MAASDLCPYLLLSSCEGALRDRIRNIIYSAVKKKTIFAVLYVCRHFWLDDPVEVRDIDTASIEIKKYKESVVMATAPTRFLHKVNTVGTPEGTQHKAS